AAGPHRGTRPGRGAEWTESPGDRGQGPAEPGRAVAPERPAVPEAARRAQEVGQARPEPESESGGQGREPLGEQPGQPGRERPTAAESAGPAREPGRSAAPADAEPRQRREQPGQRPAAEATAGQPSAGQRAASGSPARGEGYESAP